MDEPQLSSQLEYLEQRHQEDQAKIAELQQRIEAQDYELQEQTNRVRKIEDQLADAKLTLSRVSQIDERVDRMKNELFQLMEEASGVEANMPDYRNMFIGTFGNTPSAIA